MRIATACSELVETERAFEQAYAQLVSGLADQAPDWIFVCATIAHSPAALVSAWSALGAQRPAVHGLTSSRGVMTQRGHIGGVGTQRVALAMWGIRDEDADFGVGQALLDDGGPTHAAQRALQKALERAQRPGQLPQAVWVSAAPGVEEEVIRAVEGVLGERVLVMGGSAADDEVNGHWGLWSEQGAAQEAVLISVLFTSGEVFVGFQSGYEPTSYAGVVTEAQGRRLISIDDQPAAAVYNRWSQGLIDRELERGGNILAKSAMTPLGRPVNQLHGVTYYQLSHPAAVNAQEGSLELFTEVLPGQRLVMMRGTRESLIERAGRIASGLLQIHQLDAQEVKGALIIYCAGCMMTIEEQMPLVVEGIVEALPGVPFLGAYTFGEQGCFIGGENRHANMMIAVMLFTEEDEL